MRPWFWPTIAVLATGSLLETAVHVRLVQALDQGGAMNWIAVTTNVVVSIYTLRARWFYAVTKGL